MYRANLSFTQLNDYLGFLLCNGFVRQTLERTQENLRYH